MPPLPVSAAPPVQNRWLDLWRRYRTVLLLVSIVTLLHYNTAIHIHAAHGIYRRLYYFPIILAAFRGGTRGGLGAALLVIALYIPHSAGWIGYDPAHPVEKTLEMVLYVAVGLLSGILTDRISAARNRLAATADDLQHALDEKTRMEAELVRSTRLAAVGRLSAGLAHEIRNPLASIKGTAEVLSDDYPAEHPKRRMLTILLEEANRLNGVLTRFLSFARSEPGPVQEVDLVATARDVADFVAHQDDAADIVLAAMPDDGIRVRTNREQIRQVLLNLILNASASAGPKGHVRIGFEAAGEDLLACVIEDDGPGFTPEAVAQFGTPFFSTREGGTGLGLATSLRIVEDLGGRLAVDDGVETGARVLLALPRTDAVKGGD